MSYPEKNAHYRNKPAWLDRAVEGEKRAQGGPIQIGNHAVGNGAGVADIADAATDDAKDDLSENMKSQARTSGWERGEYKSKGPTKGNLENRDMMDKALGKDEAEKFRQENGTYADGGKVEPKPQPPLTPESNQFNPDSPTGRFPTRSPRPRA